MVKRYVCVWDEEVYPPDGMELVAASEYDAAQARIAALEAENEKLLSQVCQWSESCIGRHGSQEQCVPAETKVEREVIMKCPDCCCHYVKGADHFSVCPDRPQSSDEGKP